MTSILKSDSNGKNGIILKESTKKFVEATSTSGCDSEMSEITSSIPNSLSLLNVLNSETPTKLNESKEFSDTKLCEMPETAKSLTSIEVTYELEDIIDGFSIFSFATDEDLMKFSIKHEKVELLTESDSNNKIKKFSRTKTKSKIFKNVKESNCNDECIDIYDFQANSESSPSSKHSSVIFKKSISKNHSTKYSIKSKYKFKNENNSSLSEENSSNTSVTESHNLSIVDGHNDSPQPTSNDDNNVVSTTTPDNLNIEIRKSDSLNNSGKSHSPALKTASLRLFKLEDELTMPSLNRNDKIPNNNAPSASSIGSVIEKISNNQLRLHCADEKFQSKIVPTKFSVDLLTTVTDRQLVIDESNLCLNNNSNNNNNSSSSNINNINNNLKNSPEIDIINSVQPVSTNIRANNLKSIDSNSVDSQSSETIKMSSVGVKHVSGINCRSSTPFRDSILDSNGLYNENRLSNTSNSNSQYLPNDEESHNEKLINEKVMSAGLLASSYHKDVDVSQNPMASWLNLQYNKSLYNSNLPGQQQLQQQQQQHGKTLLQANSTNYPMMPPKTANSYNALKNSTNNSNNSNNHISSNSNNNNNSSNNINNNNNNNNSSIHNNNSKLQHDSAMDWPNSYFDSAKILPGSMQKFNPSIGSLSYDLTNNIRYQQEQQDLMNALRLKHENAKISKPLVQLGIDAMYKLDPTSFKNLETRFPNHNNSNTNNYFMPSTQMHIDFNSANVFKSRSDTRSRHNCTDPVTNKPLPALSSSSTSNFKTPETAKKRGHWCDMHVKIAYFIYRSQKRLSITKSQEINAQLPHLIYADKIPSATPTPSITQYPNTLLQHSNPYLDFRSSQMKTDSNFLNYQSKSSSAFPSSPIRPLNSYPYMLPQNLDLDIPPNSNNPLDEHHQTAEQKWMRLLNQYMTTNHTLSNLDRTNIDAMNQFYLWCQQFTQSNPQVPHFNSSIPTSPLQTPNLDANSVYVRKYMEQLSSYLGSLKNEGNAAYINNAMTEREMHILLMKQQQQQYQKAMLSKYQSTLNKSTNLSSHINPLINSVNSFYSKMKPLNPDPIIPHYPDCNPSLINHKYRLTHDHIRQMKYDQLAANHHLRNGYSKPPENINPKRRKLNSDSAKSFQVDLLANEKEIPKPSIDLSPENNNSNANNINNNNSNNNNNNNNNSKNINHNTVSNNNNNTTSTNTSNTNNTNNTSSNNSNVENRSSNSRENSNFHLQAVASESRK